MGKISINLRKWIVLSALHEKRSMPDVPNGSGNADEPRQHYVERAINISLLLLDCLKNNGQVLHCSADKNPSDCHAIRVEDIAPEKFMAEITTHAEVQPEGDVEEVQYIAEGSFTGVHFSASPTGNPVDSSTDSEKIMESDAYFQKIGCLLCEIFCRGEIPSLQSNNGRHPSAESESQSAPTKKMNKKSDLYPYEGLFAGYDVPLSIYRLVSDLMRSGEAMETPFLSLDDIITELKQLSDDPEIFLYPSSKTLGTEKLEFGESLHGRASELYSVLQTAARVSIERNSLRNNLVLIKGHAGSGKSSFVKNIQEPMSNLGFMHISAKFDRLAQHQPLSTIASAFDEFFVSIAVSRQNEEVDENLENILFSMERDLTAAGIAILSNLMPGLRNLFPNILRRVVSDPDLTVLGEAQQQISYSSEQQNIVQDDEESTSNAESSRNRLHYLFRRLVSAVSSPEHPLLIFLDDLQWIDQGSLDLISSLLLDFDHLYQFGNDNISQAFLVIGTYRDDEVDQSHILFPCIRTFDESDLVQVNNIHLSGMPTECTNLMISMALGLPLRLTRTLTDVIMTKTLGNPFHIKAFAKSLVDEKLLYYSLAEKRWVWDIDAVRAVSVDETVAELLARKLLQLPDNVQEALKVISCFGSHINSDALQLLSQAEVWADLTVGLDAAANESILEKHGQAYIFAHDLPQQASYELMDDEERCKTHFDIGMHLISTTSDDSDLGPLAFVAISQINRARSFGAAEIFREQFAALNLKAGRRSIEVSDFATALSFLEYGINYLPEKGWESSYELNLALHENAALSCFVLSRVDDMKALLNEIFEHANCLEDKLKGYFLLIRSLAGFGSLDEATEKVMNVLAELGEDFPASEDITPDLIRKELVSTQKLLNNVSKEDILSLRQITDTKKMWALKYFAIFLLYLYHSRPKYLPLVASRVIKISTSFGYSSDSAFGFISFGHSLILLRQDIDCAYRLGKMALMLLEGQKTNDAHPRVKFWFYSLFAYWKEPSQVIVDSLRQNEIESLTSGNNEFAALSAMACCRQSFHAGENLDSLDKRCAISISMTAKLHMLNVQIALVSHHLTVLKLMGSSHDPFAAFNGALPVKNEDQLLHFAIKKGKLSITHIAYFSKMLISFWFKRYTEAGEMAMKYDGSRYYGFADVIFVFYKGLIALNLARHHCNETESWMDIAEKSIASLRLWNQHSSWNFENRLLLLEAEWHHTKCENEQAQEKYEAAIESARKHLFVHEEGLGNELCSDFHLTNGNVDKAKGYMAEARACYENWGAKALVERIDASVLC